MVDDVRVAESGRPSRKLANELPYWEKLDVGRIRDGRLSLAEAEVAAAVVAEGVSQ